MCVCVCVCVCVCRLFIMRLNGVLAKPAAFDFVLCRYFTITPVSEPSERTGSTNLMSAYGLEHSYNKFSGKKLKEQLSAFLPNLPGNIDTPGLQDNRCLLFIII